MAKVSVFRFTQELVHDRGRSCISARDPQRVTRLDSAAAAVALLAHAGAVSLDRDEYPDLWEAVDEQLFSAGLLSAHAADPAAVLLGGGAVWAITRSDAPRAAKGAT